MNRLPFYSSSLSLLYETLSFFKRHILTILSLGLIAAVGRVIQLGGFGQITTRTHLMLEVVVESVRIILFLYVLGLASLQKGTLSIRRLVTDRTRRKHYFQTSVQTIRKKWLELLVSFLIFMVIAWLINYAIDLLAYQTCLYLKLKQNEIISPTSSEWTIILFFKNISVIPLTLTFYAVSMNWLLNRFRKTDGMLPETA
jgi:hypothetical protein